MPKESIVDASVPSAGRVYDYLLGGHHNFEVDRRAAEYVISLAPFVTKFVRLQRWCLRDVAHELTTVRGYDTIIDFASGLPTPDNLHGVTPEGTTVIYSDYDPVVVQYAHEILGDTPNIHFFEANAARPEELLGRPEVQEILQGRRNVAVVYWGVGLFLADDDIRHAASYLHDWTGERACFAFNLQGVGLSRDNPAGFKILDMYAKMGSSAHVRSAEEYQELLKPWQVDDKGLMALLAWHGLDQSEMSGMDLDQFGSAGAGYGAYLVK
jgi:hypothetical protein